MITRILGTSGLQVSSLGLGCMGPSQRGGRPVGNRNGSHQEQPDRQRGRQVVDGPDQRQAPPDDRSGVLQSGGGRRGRPSDADNDETRRENTEMMQIQLMESQKLDTKIQAGNMFAAQWGARLITASTANIVKMIA